MRVPPPTATRAAAAAGAVLALDLAARTCRPRRSVAGVLDEAAHLATGAVLAAAVAGRGSAALRRGILAGSLALDADHVPDALGHRHLRHGDERPYPHSLGVVLVPVLVAATAPPRSRRRGAAAGVAAGLALHLLRDLATPRGTGVMLAWPASTRRVTVPYGVYAGALAALAARATWAARATRSRR